MGSVESVKVPVHYGHVIADVRESWTQDKTIRVTQRIYEELYLPILDSIVKDATKPLRFPEEQRL